MSLDLLDVKNDYKIYVKSIITPTIDNDSILTYDRDLNIAQSVTFPARINIGPPIPGPTYNVYINGTLFAPYPTALTYNIDPINLTFTGAVGPNPVTVACVFEKIGKTVTLSIPLVNEGDQAFGLITSSTFPLIYRPTVVRSSIVLVRSSIGDGNGIVVGSLNVNPNGTVTVGLGVDLNNNLTNFNGGGTTSNALLECVIVYTI